MTLPLSQESPADSPKGDSRFSRFFKNLRGNDSRESIATRKSSVGKQPQVHFQSTEFLSRDSPDSSESRGLPTTPDVDINQYFLQFNKPTGYDSKIPEKPRDLDTPEQRGMLGVYEDFMRAQRGTQWRDGDLGPMEREAKLKDDYSAHSRPSDDLKISPVDPESHDLGTSRPYDWSRDVDNATLTPMTPHVPSSCYSIHKENPYLESRDASREGDKSREIYDFVTKSDGSSKPRGYDNCHSTTSDPPSRASRASRVFFALTLTCLLIILKTRVTTIILNYGIEDSQIYSQTACATLNTYAATTHFGPNLLYSAITGQAAGYVGDMAQGLLPGSDVTMRTPGFVDGLLSQMKQDYVHSLTHTIDFGVDLTKNTTSKNARDAQKVLSEELKPLQDNITLFETSLNSLSANLLKNPIFGFEKSGNTSQLSLDRLKNVNFSDIFFSDFLPHFQSSFDVSKSFQSPFSSAKDAILTDLDNFNNGVRKLALNLPTAKAVAKQLDNSSYNQLFSTFKLCTKEDEIKEHYEKMVQSINSKSGAVVVLFVVFAVIFLLITCFLELFGLTRKKQLQKVSYLRKLKLTESHVEPTHSKNKSHKPRDFIPFPHHLSTLTIVTVAVAVSCICDLSLLSSLRISGGAQIEFVSDMYEYPTDNVPGSVSENVSEPVEHANELNARDLESEDDAKPLGYTAVDYMAIFSTADKPSATLVETAASVATPVHITDLTNNSIATLHNISSDIIRLVDSANIYLEGLQTNLETECLSFQSQLLKGVNSTLMKLEKDLNEAVANRFGFERGDIGSLNSDKFLSAILDKSRHKVAAGTAKLFKIDSKQAVLAFSQAHINSLPGFAPLQTKTTIATSLENLVDMMQKVVLSQQWFALGLFIVWILIMIIGGVRWILAIKREVGFINMRVKRWEV